MGVLPHLSVRHKPRWGGTHRARTGGVLLRRLLEDSSRWPQRHLEAESTTLRLARYFTPTSCAGAEPTSALHLYRGLAHMLASGCDHKFFGGVGAELCHRQQPADTKVSGRTGRAMGCGGCAFTCVSCMLHRLQLVIMNIFILSFNLRPTSTRPSSGFTGSLTPSHSMCAAAATMP